MIRGTGPSGPENIRPGLSRILSGLGDFDTSIERRGTVGGSARASVAAQLAELDAEFAPRDR